jgi:hypothetical protein
MYLVVQNRPVGFFSNFNTIVGTLFHLEQQGVTDIVVKWENELYQNHLYNLFDEFFLEQKYYPNASVFNHQISNFCDATLMGSYYFNFILDRKKLEKYNYILKKYKHFESRAYLECKKNILIKPKTLGVHIRKTDHSLHSQIIDTEKFISLIDEKLYNGEARNVFLMTDDTDTYNLFKQKYNNILITNNVYRSMSHTSIHHGTFPNKRRLAYDVLTDAISMTFCEQIIVTSSNISSYVLMSNPQIEFTQLDTDQIHQ